jgi:hypothetical protein
MHATNPEYFVLLDLITIGLTNSEYKSLTSLLDLKEIWLFVKILNEMSPEIIQQYIFVNMVVILRVQCGLVVGVSGHRSRGLGSIPGATRFSEN